MCLDTITKSVENKTNNTIWVWKVFFTDSRRKLYFVYKGNSSMIKEERWLNAKKTNFDKDDIFLCTNYGSSYYENGFHGFLRKKDAQCYSNYIFGGVYLTKLKIKKVKFRKVHTYGRTNRDLCLSTVVAEEMFIPKEKKKVCMNGKNRKNM